MITAGRNPLHSRESELRKQRAVRSFGEITREFYEAKSHDWRNAKVRKQWMTPLERNATRLMPMPVNEIGSEDVLAVLQPIWTTKPVHGSEGGSRPCLMPRELAV